MQESVLSLIRREVRREEGLLIDVEDLAKGIHDMLSAEARELIGPMRVRRKRAASVRRAGVTKVGNTFIVDGAAEPGDAIPSEESSSTPASAEEVASAESSTLKAEA